MKRIIFTLILLVVSSSVIAEEFKNNSFYLFSDVLLWEVREGGADNWAQHLTPPGRVQTDTIIEAPFDVNTGFRVGIGYQLPQQLYDFVFSYTQYQTTATNQAEGNVYSAYLGNFYSTNTNGSTFEPYYDSGNIDWDFSYQVFDIDVGKTFNIDQILTIRPFLGLRAAIIDQTIETHWQGPHNSSGYAPITSYNNAAETIENNFWGIGPAIGVNTTWPIYQSPKNMLGVVGDFDGSIYWGHWSFKDNYTNDTPVSININSADIYGAATMARAFVGLKSQTYLSKASLGIKLGYEAQVWFNQMQLYSLNMGRMNNLMSLQGGVLDVSLNF